MWMDDARWGGRSWLCFNKPVFRVICSSAVLTLSLNIPHLPSLPVLCLYIGIKLELKRCAAAVTTAGDCWVPNDP